MRGSARRRVRASHSGLSAVEQLLEGTARASSAIEPQGGPVQSVALDAGQGQVTTVERRPGVAAVLENGLLETGAVLALESGIQLVRDVLVEGEIRVVRVDERLPGPTVSQQRGGDRAPPGDVDRRVGDVQVASPERLQENHRLVEALREPDQHSS